MPISSAENPTMKQIMRKIKKRNKFFFLAKTKITKESVKLKKESDKKYSFLSGSNKPTVPTV